MIHDEYFEALKSYIANFEKTLEKEKQIISNYDYISWLENFTKIHKNFRSDTWLYRKEELSKEDYSNVEKLYLFFNAISSYCIRFHIDTEGNGDFAYERIHIQHNNVGYYFTLARCQGSNIYVDREAPHINAIEFENIMNNIVPEESKTKEKLLEKFEKIVSAMKEADIPSKVVTNTLKKYYNF